MAIDPKVQAAIDQIQATIQAEAQDIQSHVQTLADSITNGSVSNADEIVAALEAINTNIGNLSDAVVVNSTSTEPTE